MSVLLIAVIDDKSPNRPRILVKPCPTMLQIISRSFCKVAKGDNCKRNCRGCKFETTSQYYNLAKFTLFKMLETKDDLEKRKAEKEKENADKGI